MRESDYSGVQGGGRWLEPTGLLMAMVGVIVALAGVYVICLWITSELSSFD
jgi:hypothetical protein